MRDRVAALENIV